MSLFAHRNLLRALAVGQALSLGAAGCKSEGPSVILEQQKLAGADGAYTVTAAKTVVNGYSALVGAVAAGATSINVYDVTEFADTAAGTALKPGDLVMLIQMAGASIDTSEGADYGRLTSLGSAGRYELVGVNSVSGNTIGLACALKNSYNGAGGAQVVRVPQYTTLKVNTGASITALPWDGTRGGVVVLQAGTSLQLDGDIDVSAQGFRGGDVDNEAGDAALSVSLYRSDSALDGGRKGEGVAGVASLQTTGGAYGRGAPANAGGGGDSHNAAGGGGANASADGTWTGNGVMSTATAGWESAWHLEVGTTGALASSPGGGRGGYSYSSENVSPVSVAPGSPDWGGNRRRVVGGLGGRPLPSATGGASARLFMGGGGGAGDGNNSVAGKGGRGGGLVFVLAGAVSGAGRVLANGEPGGDATSLANASGDAAGGGGGGGTVVIHADTLAGVSVQAKGGVGGNQSINKTLSGDTPYEAEGPGGGGGGGFVALSGGSVSTSVAGGTAGTTNARSMGAFTVNGATDGHAGLANGDATTIVSCLDASAPDTTIATSPKNPSNLAKAPFTFTSNEEGATFECALDSTTFSACPHDYTTDTLAEGPHSIKVRAVDPSGNVDATPATFDWVVDLAPPDTKIESRPTDPSGPNVTFTFSSTEDDSTFECRLDVGSWKAWAASHAISELATGSHTIYVRAVDKAGNVDPSPASYTWMVDAALPDTQITSNPANPSASTTVVFTFSSDKPDVTFECRWEKTGDWAPCTTPLTKSGLTNGTHTFEVRAKDALGNVDPEPAVYTWTVNDNKAPETSITAHPSEISTATQGAFTFASDEPGATFECRLDGKDWKACPASHVAEVSIGSHTIEVRAKDAAGNVDGSPATFTWIVQTGVIVDAGPSEDAGSDDAGDGGPMLPDGGASDAVLDASDAHKTDAAGDATADTGVDTRPADAAAADTRPLDAATPVDAHQFLDAPEVVPGGDDTVKVMGGGFCAVNPGRGSGPGVFTLFLVGAQGTLIVRRRRR